MNRFSSRFGDGFSTEANPAIKQQLLSSEMLPLETHSNHNQMAMAVRPMKTNLHEWLAVDWSYASFAKARKMLLDTRRDQVIAHRKCEGRDEEVEKACKEVLEMVIQHLTTKYPQFFQKSGTKVHNALTGETFDTKHTSLSPLEIAVRLAIEDFNILLPREIQTEKGTEIQYQLAATATLFPAAWIIKEKVGTRVVDLHTPVPGWHEKLAIAVESRLKKIGFGINGKGEKSTNEQMERLVVFPQIDQPNFDLGELLFVQDGDKFYPPGVEPNPSTMLFRRERQTARRISSVNGVLFSVRTSIQFFDEVEKEELAATLEQVMKLAESHATYKARDRWLPCLQKYAEEKFGWKV